jgi:predicted small lipoprotein YifL
MRYLIIFLMLAIVYASLTSCGKKPNVYGLKGFFNVEKQNETNKKNHK